MDVVCAVEIAPAKGQGPEEEWESVPSYTDGVPRVSASVLSIYRQKKKTFHEAQKGAHRVGKDCSDEPVSKNITSTSTTNGPPREGSRLNC